MRSNYCISHAYTSSGWVVVEVLAPRHTYLKLPYNMIRISELAAIDIVDEQSMDINASPIYCYTADIFGKEHKQILFDDAHQSKPNTRSKSYAHFWQNTLLGTQNSYPENGLAIPDYHQNSRLQEKMSEAVLPLIETKTARLYFGQGLLSDENIQAHMFRVYVKLSDNTTVTLASFVDFVSDTSAVAVPVKYFESQVFEEAIDFEFIDVDFLLNSGIPEVQAIKQYLFGSSKPIQYFFEYSVVTADGIDVYEMNGYSFTKTSPASLNQQSLLIDVGADSLNAILRLRDDKFAYVASLKHDQFDITAYMDSQKNPGEIYSIEYHFTVSEYLADEVINVQFQRLISNDFEPQTWRPVISVDAEYAKVDLTIRVHNISTGMVFRRDATQVMILADVQNFKPVPAISLNLTANPVNKIVNRIVNKVVQSNETPKVVQMEKRVYVQVQPLDAIRLLEGVSVIELQLSDTITGHSKMYLKIGSLTFENLQDSKAMFEVSEHAYSERTNRYMLLDEQMKTITTGEILR